jgi:hypothetical protein
MYVELLSTGTNPEVYKHFKYSRKDAQFHSSEDGQKRLEERRGRG